MCDVFDECRKPQGSENMKKKKMVSMIINYNLKCVPYSAPCVSDSRNVDSDNML